MAESAPSPTGAGASRSFSPPPEEQSTIYVGNLSWSTDNEALTDAFVPFTTTENPDEDPTKVTATVVMRDGRSAGFGFVNFIGKNAAADAAKAIAEMNNSDLHGRTITVQERIQKSGGGGRGRGGFGGGRGRGGFNRDGGGYGGREGGYGGGREGGYGGRDGGYGGGRDGGYGGGRDGYSRGDSYRGGGRGGGGGWGRDSGRDNSYSGGNGSREGPY